MEKTSLAALTRGRTNTDRNSATRSANTRAETEKSERKASERSAQEKGLIFGEGVKAESDHAFDGMLFQALINNPMDLTSAGFSQGDGIHSGGSPARQAPINAPFAGAETPFTDLLDKVSESALDGDFQCSLFLPRLGEIAISAQQTQHKWIMQLDFVNQRSFDYCRKSKKQMKEELAARMGKAVDLELRHKGQRDED